MAAGAARGPFYRRLFAWLGRFEDGAILRTAFFALLAGTLGVLYVDYRELGAADSAALGPTLPLLPGFAPTAPFGPSGPTPELTTDRALLQGPLEITLVAGRVLDLTGTIDPGAAERFAAEIESYAEYIDTVALNSPGGSVADALKIGSMIRSKGFSTHVASGALCASSCPLVFAGGVERAASPNAAIGVHQVYAVPTGPASALPSQSGGLAMADAQKTTALITRHLIELGVDGALWLHALETPPTELYFLSPEELVAFKLATELAES